jgi:hypothetical protein
MLENAESGVEKSNSRQFASLKNRNANNPSHTTIRTSTIRRVTQIRLMSDNPEDFASADSVTRLAVPMGISDGTSIAIDPRCCMPIRFSIVAESMPLGALCSLSTDNLVGTSLRRQNDRPKQLMAAKAITQRVSGTDAFVLMTPIRGEPVMAIVPDASSRSLAS